jgi:hypothetical protein
MITLSCDESPEEEEDVVPVDMEAEVEAEV